MEVYNIAEKINKLNGTYFCGGDGEREM